MFARLQFYRPAARFDCPVTCPVTSGWPAKVVVVVVVRKFSKKLKKKNRIFENFGTDLGWFGDDFGMVWGYFRDGFGPTLKSRKIEGPESKN